jgi:hypothetical protein
MGLTFTAHGNFVTPNVLGILRNKAGNLGGDVARGDSVGTSEANPLNRKGLA